MIKDSIKAIAMTARQLLGSWQSMALLAAVYALLLAALYFFIITVEASISQLVITAALAISVPVLFFILQTMSALFIQESGQPNRLLQRSLKEFWKLVLITIPVILLAAAVVYLLIKLQTRFSIGASSAPPEPLRIPRVGTSQTQSKSPPIQWGLVLFNTVRYLLFAVAFPLATIHLWISAARDGLKTTVTKVKTIIPRALSPQAILIYVAGFVVFAVIPHFVLLKALSVKRPWAELAIFVARLFVVFLLTLFGWVVTIGALSLTANGSIEKPTKQES